MSRKGPKKPERTPPGCVNRSHGAWAQWHAYNARKKKRKKVATKAKPAKLQVSDYGEYLRGVWWRAKRLQKLKSVGYRCQRCSATTELAVHHRHYRTLGRENNDDLEVLCKTCHDAHHEAVTTCNSHLRSINNGQ